MTGQPEPLEPYVHRGETSCCVGCHFDFEHKYALPCLPAWAREMLQREHDDLRIQKFPWLKVALHAAKEMGLFRIYCPPDVVARIEADHRKFDAKHG